MAARMFCRLCVLFLAAAATIALLGLSSGESKAQWVPGSPQFQPTVNFKLCNDLDPDFYGPADLQGGGGMCSPDTIPLSHPDTTLSFALPQGSMNYAQSYFVTTGGGDTNGNTVIDPDEEARLDGSQIGGANADGTGAAAGGLNSLTTMGLVVNPCNTVISPNFIWWEAEYDVTDTVACAPECSDDRWANLAVDGGDAWAGHGDRNSPAVTQFPDCIVRLFDPDGSGDCSGGSCPVEPRARFVGLTQVPPGADWQMLQVVEFDPGDLQAAFAANPGTTQHPYAKLYPNLGYNQVIVLNDPKAVLLQRSPISDFCSTLSTRGMLKGQIDTNGDTVPDIERVTSPAMPGSYMVQARTQSLRDADGDGLENNFDTCPWTPNTAAEDPYVNSGPDMDMLDSACDPTPGAAIPPYDQDGDGYYNSQDWCPLVAAPLCESDSENAQLYNNAVPLPNTVVKDGGPQADQIGDGCDDVVRTWKDEFENNTGTTVDDLHLTFDVGKTIFKVVSISGGTGPDTWNWKIDGHGVNTVAADCASHAADNVVDITGTGGTKVENGHTLAVVVQPCEPDKVTTLSVTAQWTWGGMPVGAPFVVVNVPKYTASPTVSDGLYFNAVKVDSVCITDYDAHNLEDGNNQPNQDTSSPYECADGADNDGDTLIDSGDADCSDGMADADSDGWCDDIDVLFDDDTYNPSLPEDPPAGGAGSCGNTTDDGRDGLTDRYDDDCNSNADIPGLMMTTLMDSVAGDPDDDGDGYDSVPEWYLGVDPGNDCPLFSGEHDAWPPDFDMNRVINILDVGEVLPPVFGSSAAGGPPFTSRADLDPNGFINIIDVGQTLPPVFGSSCTP